MLPNNPQMAANSFLSPDVDLAKLAEVTKNFSGAELEGLVKSAASFALNRNVDINDLHKPLDEENIKVGGGSYVFCACVCMCVCLCVSAFVCTRVCERALQRACLL
jgi:hypothetical protein